MESVFEFIPAGVSDEFVESLGIPFELAMPDTISAMQLPRSDFAHKGTYGHALIVCGSRGMTGAAILATGAALRSGCGLVTAHIPDGEHIALAANHPSALLSIDPSREYFARLPDDISRYSAVGVGCGLGQRRETVDALAELMAKCTESGVPMVLDADALNIIAADVNLKSNIPANSILTPHLGELKRLIGKWEDDEERIIKTYEFAVHQQVIVVVKGPNTMTCIRGKRFVFNSTGNSGMAKGGSGDVLTGFITGLLARGYFSDDAAVAGVYLHGAAGDKARDYYGAEGMNSGDIADFLAEAISDVREG